MTPTAKPIPFSGPMVRALLDGRKTQTRRVVKLRGHRTLSEFGPSDTNGYHWHFRDSEKRWHDYRHDDLLKRLPYQSGDRLWVREAWRTADAYDDLPPRDLSGESTVWYESDGKIQAWGWTETGQSGRYRHARFMPRWASRLTLTVTDVRVQRLQDISEGDAIAEGIEPYSGIDPDCCGYLNYLNNSEDGWWLAPIQSFRTLWNSINGPEAWDADPWVDAYTFTVHRCNIDELEAQHG